MDRMLPWSPRKPEVSLRDPIEPCGCFLDKTHEQLLFCRACHSQYWHIIWKLGLKSLICFKRLNYKLLPFPGYHPLLFTERRCLRPWRRWKDKYTLPHSPVDKWKSLSHITCEWFLSQTAEEKKKHISNPQSHICNRMSPRPHGVYRA